MASMIDFRFMDEGLRKGKKRAREQEAAEEKEQAAIAEAAERGDAVPSAKRIAVPMDEDSDRPMARPAPFSRPTYDGVIAGKVSGRGWKDVKTSRASSMKVKAGKPLSLERKQAEREAKKLYRARVAELKEEIRSNKVEKRKAAVERKKKKEENVLKSGTLLQKITNPKKLKNMSKKQKKALKVVQA
eukprot:TRINITY_DN1379_c0_g1_i1.p2 TRINITY_DN1379_c0_g1~~TRINITY_DN1379_c0_g1_i1.p2  ORF type:complete len:187 (+),score=60.97 TRINITY_DN1379_c0_g1_i1:489-1049(+)